MVLLSPGSWKSRSIWHEVLSLKETVVVNKDALVMFRFQLAYWLPADHSQPVTGFVGYQELSSLCLLKPVLRMYTHWLPAFHSDHHPEFSKPMASVIITGKVVIGGEKKKANCTSCKKSPDSIYLMWIQNVVGEAAGGAFTFAFQQSTRKCFGYSWFLAFILAIFDSSTF